MKIENLLKRTFRAVISNGNKIKGEARYYPLFYFFIDVLTSPLKSLKIILFTRILLR